MRSKKNPPKLNFNWLVIVMVALFSRVGAQAYSEWIYLPSNTADPNPSTGDYADFKYNLYTKTYDLTGHDSNLCVNYESDFIAAVDNQV